MSYCAKCNKERYPVDELQPDGRIVTCCPICLSPVGQDLAPSPTATLPASEPVRKRIEAPRTEANIVDVIKGRLEAARGRLEALRDAETEVAMLERMLDAAEQPQLPKRGHVALAS